MTMVVPFLRNQQRSDVIRNSVAQSNNTIFPFPLASRFGIVTFNVWIRVGSKQELVCMKPKNGDSHYVSLDSKQRATTVSTQLWCFWPPNVLEFCLASPSLEQ